MASRLKDIALATGYSVNTVSLALRGSTRINETTRKKIVSAAKKANYVPNQVARSLVKQQTMTIGVILTDITNPILTLVAHYIERLLAKLSYTMVLVTTDQNLEREKQSLNTLRAQRVDGILVFPADHDVLSHLEPLQDMGYPLVLLAGNRTASFDLIAMDETLGAYKAVRHLIELGHRRIALFCFGEEKLEGYQQALREHGLLDPSLIIETSGGDYEHGYRAAPALAQLKPAPTALLAATDYLALGAISWCKAQGINVPEDLAVIGFDDIDAAKYSDPALSSVIYDAARISQRAVSRLMERIAETKSVAPERTEKTIIEPELALRYSSGTFLKNAQLIQAS